LRAIEQSQIIWVDPKVRDDPKESANDVIVKPIKDVFDQLY